MALISAYLIHAISIVLQDFFYNSFGAFTGTLMFGITFMGITTMAISSGRYDSTQKNAQRSLGI